MEYGAKQGKAYGNGVDFFQQKATSRLRVRLGERLRSDKGKGCRLVFGPNEGDSEIVTTTLELPDELMRKAEETAAGSGQSLQSFLAEAIKSKLCAEGGDATRDQVLSYAGVFRDSREESLRIMETIESGCEQVEPEDWQ